MGMFYKIQCSNVQLSQLQTRLSCRGSVELNKYTFLSSFASCSLNYQKKSTGKILISLQIMISLGPFIDHR